ncbi:hypothetical protein [Roseobacter fucihabitans]|uniref:hypothetical protein n=1 Tax=Roseobacter fucihabitans TaxID=1537242 RepID=UPI0021CCE5B4|nr:hypothetical protein [Roseobacter litoralis]
MTAQWLQPTIPFNDDEVTQGYFARIGHFQTGVDAGRLCRFFDLARADFRDGNNQCVEVIAATSGESSSRLEHNGHSARYKRHVEVARRESWIVDGQVGFC